MITGVAFAIILAVAKLRGGDLMRLGELRPRHPWTVFGAVVIQFVVITLLAAHLPFAVASGLHLFSYGLALAFVWFNRATTGIGLIVLGGCLNLAAIAANHGVMPASAAALEFAGKPVDTGEFENSTTQDDARLQILGDVFAFPEGMPFANVFSIGDVILVVGGHVLVSRACLPSRRPDTDDAPTTAAVAPPTPAPPTRPPGWYPDPAGAPTQRWWTGAAFTRHTTVSTPRTRPPGWYPRPDGSGGERWWTGATWSPHTTTPAPVGPPDRATRDAAAAQ